MNKEMQLYYDYTVSPLGELFYKTVWRQFGNIKNKKILDFGSGFAFTSNFLAENNAVTAIELDKEMIDCSKKSNTFTQLHGGLELIKDMPKESFDIIICHLVLEFVENPEEILATLMPVLKKEGRISLIRHNRLGRIIQAIVQDNDLDDATKLLEGAYSYSSAFGNIKYYENEDLLAWSNNNLEIENIYGVRALASLHNAATQNSKDWLENMLKIEWKLLKDSKMIDISYFNHLILKKK